MQRSPATSDPLGALLAAAAPPPLEPATGAARVDELSAALAREVVAADRTVRGRVRGLRRRHRLAVAATAATIVFVPTGAWAAQHFLAQTGRFGNARLNPDFEDRSEYVNLCAKDFADYVTALAPRELPAPPGHSWAGYASAMAATSVAHGECATTTEGVVQETSLRGELLARASGDWGCTLVWATEDGDRAAAAAARRQMLDLDAKARRLSSIEGTVGTQDPDVFLANSRLPQWVGCRR
jgi:hypothetical protein